VRRFEAGIRIQYFVRTVLVFGLVPFADINAEDTIEVAGLIVDAEDRVPLAARLYIESESGEWFHARSGTASGEAIPYSKVRANGSVEVHTTLSTGSFTADLPIGSYTLTVEKGKEYFPSSVEIAVTEESDQPISVVFPLRRWTNMAAKGWYSGETHVHRKVSELPTLMFAEDLNVTFPLTSWVTDSRDTPVRNNKNPDPVPPAKLVEVDSSHVIWPVNTEYEIFTVNGNRHTLGAVFILNHRHALDLAVPPVTPVAVEARRQGALLELDKHNWPWSMMLVPVMDVGLFELTNNHIWRTQFQFKNWYPEYAGDYMDIEMIDGAFTERGWIDFGFQNYYALLNCGFRMAPTAGTASGVHPVPLGFGRVYVKIDGAFSYEKWLKELVDGRSFVTTGPMLLVDQVRDGNEVAVIGSFESSSPLGRIEIVVNGEVFKTVVESSVLTSKGSHVIRFNERIPLKTTSWIGLRGFEDRLDDRLRFAHTAPGHYEVPGIPLQPRKEEIDYLKGRVEAELERHRGVLDDEALGEYEKALAFYGNLQTR